MKIITNNATYVQKNDLTSLTSSDIPVPASIITKVFGQGVTVINDRNRYDFVKFTEPHEIEFFNNCTWMIDYNEVKDLTENEILSLAHKIANEQADLLDKFDSMSDEEKEKNLEMKTKCDLLYFKFYSLRDVHWFKHGHLKFQLPKEIIETSKKADKKRKIFINILKKNKDK